MRVKVLFTNRSGEGRGNIFAIFASGETGTEVAAYSARVKAVIKLFAVLQYATSQDGTYYGVEIPSMMTIT